MDAIKVSTGSSSAEKSKGTVDSGGKKVNPAKSTAPPPSVSRSREMLSPILGSEALYKQAGWMTPTFSAGNGSSGASESEADEGIQQFLDVNTANKDYSATHHSSHGIEMSPPSLENDSDAIEDDSEAKRSSRGASTDGLGTTQAALGNNSGGAIKKDARVAQRSANLIQKEMIKLTDSGKSGKFGNGFSLIDLIRPMPMSEDVDFDNGNLAEGSTSQGAAPEEDEMVIPKSMREIYKLSNANRRRPGKEKVVPKPLEFPDANNKEIEKCKEDGIGEAEAVIASSGGPDGYFGSSGSKRQRTSPGKEGDIKLMTKMGWVKDKKEAESLAVVPVDQQAAEKDRNNHNGPQYKKANASGGKGGGDYYSNMGTGLGAFDPAATSKNPFFAGAATGAAAMVHGGESKGKSQKRNKKR